MLCLTKVSHIEKVEIYYIFDLKNHILCQGYIGESYN